MIFNRFALIEIRRIRGLTQADLVRSDDVSSSYVSALESGDRDRPSLETITSLAEALDIDPRALYVNPDTDRLIDELVEARERRHQQ